MKIMWATLSPILELILKVVGIILVLLSPILISILVHYIIYHFRGYRRKRKIVYSNKESVLKRLILDFPKRFVTDIYSKNPNEFSYYGFWLFAGEQGAGKTISAVDFCQKIKNEYPLSQLVANIGISGRDKFLSSHEDIIFNNNGNNGTICLIDEIQNWFSSSERVGFPPEMIQEICQQRKQHKVVIGTSQCFSRISLPLRQQVNYLCLPMTIANCLTIVRVYKPFISEDGKVKKKRHFKTWFFVHSDRLRNSYNTFEKVKRLSLKGFNLDTYSQKK